MRLQQSARLAGRKSAKKVEMTFSALVSSPWTRRSGPLLPCCAFVAFKTSFFGYYQERPPRWSLFEALLGPRPGAEAHV